MAFTKRTITLTYAEASDLLQQYGSANAAAVEMASAWGLSVVHANRVIKSALLSVASSDTQAGRTRIGKLERLVELIEKSGFSVDDIGQIKQIKLGSHRGYIKNKKKQIEYTDDLPAESIVFTPAWEEGPSWPVIQPAKPVRIDCVKYEPRPRIGRTLVIIPDIQCGFLRPLDDPSNLIPIHDRQAIDVALQIIADIQPDQLVHIGDFLDLPEMSRWLQHEEFWRTTQPAIDEGHRLLAEFEAAAGPRERRAPTAFIEGNHDRRLREYALKNARAAFHLRPAMATPKDWPDLTVSHLLRFEELGIQYCGAYPGSEFWITRDLVVRHNPEKRDAYEGSVIAGHTHHIRRETLSRRTREGRAQRTIYEIGCLCRLGNYDDPRSLLRTVVPSDRGFVNGWAQGLAVVQVDDDGQFTVEQIEIIDGKALYHGRIYITQRRAA